MTGTQNKISWIGVDWGTSNLRVWLMGQNNEVLKALTSERGMARLSPQEFEPALLELIGGYLFADSALYVVCCGMVGARQAWAEARYMSAPCPPPGGEAAINVYTNDQRISVWILPGIKQVHPADVMRGEETQIAGFLAGNPEYKGVLCLPGTHTKWVRIANNRIESFQTFMTGELFSLLSKRSVLRHAMETSLWDQSAFLAALDEAMGAPEMIAAKLFSLRANGLIANQSAQTAKAKLSGLLIGLELAAAPSYWQGEKVAIIGTDFLAKLYSSGLSVQGVSADVCDATILTISGLSVAKGMIGEFAKCQEIS